MVLHDEVCKPILWLPQAKPLWGGKNWEVWNNCCMGWMINDNLLCITGKSAQWFVITCMGKKWIYLCV